MTLLSRILAGFSLIVLLPLLALISLAILIETGRPLLFWQVRVGKNGKPFRLVKFRSMQVVHEGPKITRSGDSRITKVGHFLRKVKLDELPQLWNVVAGQMSFIGPRPEVPDYVDIDDPLWRTILAFRPGITDLAALVFRNEEELLETATDPNRFYRESVLPAKLRLDIQYARSRSSITDLRLLILTIRYAFFPSGFDPDTIKRALVVEKSR